MLSSVVAFSTSSLVVTTMMHVLLVKSLMNTVKFEFFTCEARQMQVDATRVTSETRWMTDADVCHSQRTRKDGGGGGGGVAPAWHNHGRPLENHRLPTKP